VAQRIDTAASDRRCTWTLHAVAEYQGLLQLTVQHLPLSTVILAKDLQDAR
jgi:hypothetical protein